MALARGCWRSLESRSRPLQHVRSLRARTKSAPSKTGTALAAVCRLFGTESLRPTNAIDRTTGLSVAGCRLLSSAPTSGPSGCPCSRSAFDTSSATLLLLTQFLVCCIDRLNPQGDADVAVAVAQAGPRLCDQEPLEWQLSNKPNWNFGPECDVQLTAFYLRNAQNR